MAPDLEALQKRIDTTLLRKKKISATGILSCNIILINDEVIEWLDADTFRLAALANAIGIDVENKAKATVTIEITEEPCEVCGKRTTGEKLCDNCQKIVCEECAKTDPMGRYCPTCFNPKTNQPQHSLPPNFPLS